MPLSTCTTHVRHICTGHSEATGGMRFVLYWNDSGSGKPFLLPLPMQRHPCCLWPPGISFQLHWLLFGARRLPVTGEQPGEPSLFWNCSCSGGRQGPLSKNLAFPHKSAVPLEKKHPGLASFAGLLAILLSLHILSCTLCHAIFFLSGIQALCIQQDGGAAGGTLCSGR